MYARIATIDFTRLDDQEMRRIIKILFNNLDDLRHCVSKGRMSLDLCAVPFEKKGNFELGGLSFVSVGAGDVGSIPLYIPSLKDFTRTLALFDLLHNPATEIKYADHCDYRAIEDCLKVSLVTNLSDKIYTREQTEFLANSIVEPNILREIISYMEDGSEKWVNISKTKYVTPPKYDHLIDSIPKYLDMFFKAHDMDFNEHSITEDLNKYEVREDEKRYAQWFFDLNKFNGKEYPKPNFDGYDDRLSQSRAFKKIFKKDSSENLELEF